jgi:glycosyltransferase involved in cell wall biosynthesis
MESNRKKVLFIIHSLPYGGAERSLVDVLRHFDFNQYDVTLCILWDNDRDLLGDVPDGVKIIYYRDFPFSKLIRKICTKLDIVSLWFFLEKISFRFFMRKRRFDAVAGYKEGESNLFASFLFNRKNQKNILWNHASLLQDHWTMFWVFRNHKNLEYRIYRHKNLSSLVFVSVGQKDSFYKLYPDACKNYSVIHNLIDKECINDMANETAIPKTRMTFCCIGRMTFEKGFDKALEVCKILKDKGCDFELWIIGDGYDFEKLKQMTVDFGLDNNVKFLGYIKNTHPYLKSADVCLVPSVHESFSLVVAEALCLGKPVVSTPTDGPVELLEGGKYGIITSFDTNDIAERLFELVTNADRMKTFAELAHRRSTELFDSKKIMRQIYDLL